MKRCASLTVALFVLSSGLSTAVQAERYWDVNGATAGGSNSTTAAGTWGVDNFWSTSSAGTAATGAWVADETAVFSAGTNVTGTYDVTLDGTQLVAGITFEEGTVTISGGTELTLSASAPANPGDFNGDGIVDAADYVALRKTGGSHAVFVEHFGETGGAGSGGAISVAASRTATINSTIGGVGVRLTKAGAGTLNLGGFNTYDGGTTVSGGKLSFGGEATGSLGAVPGATIADNIILSGGGVLSSTENDVEVAMLFPTRGITIGAGGGGLEVAAPTAQLGLLSPIAGADRWTKSGPGELQLRTNNPFTGGIRVTGGILNHNTGESNGGVVNTSTGAVPAAVVDDYIILDGGGMKYNNTGVGSTFLSPRKGIALGANGGSITHVENATFNSITIYFGKISLDDGVTEATLTKRGGGEFRSDKLTKTEDDGWDQTQLVVEEGLFRIGHFSEETVLGQVPAVYKADAVVLNGQGTTRSTGAAAIGLTSFDSTDPVNVHNAITTTPATRGITLGPNGGTIATSIGLNSWVFESIITGPGGIHINGNGFPVSGPGPFATATATVVFKGANSYAGTTNVNSGFLVVDGATAKLGGGDVFVDGVTPDIVDGAGVQPAAGKLRIKTGVVDAISDGALLSLTGGGTALTADVGYIELEAGINETVNQLMLAGVGQAAGTYGSTSSTAMFQFDEFFLGSGILTVLSAGAGGGGAVPEPTSAALLMIGMTALALHRRR